MLNGARLSEPFLSAMFHDEPTIESLDMMGLAVAAVQRGERWTRIPLNANVALLPTPNGRFAFTLTRGF